MYLSADLIINTSTILRCPRIHFTFTYNTYSIINNVIFYNIQELHILFYYKYQSLRLLELLDVQLFVQLCGQQSND